MDKKIKNKLEDTSPEYNSTHWEMMKERLDTDGLKNMDQDIKNKLNDLQVETPIGAWSAFESYRENSSVESQWNEGVKRKLEDVPITSSSQWMMMKDRLDAWSKMRQDYYGLRIAEIVIIMLLFWTFHQYDGLWSENQSKNHPVAETIEKNNDAIIKVESNTKDDFNSSIKAESITSEVNSNSKSNQFKSEIIYSQNLATSSLEFNNMGKISKAKNKFTQFSSSSNQKSNDTEIANVVSFNDSEQGFNFSGIKNNLTSDNSVLPVLALRNPLLEYGRSIKFTKHYIDLSGSPLSIMPENSKSPIWLSFYTFLGINQIRTPTIHVEASGIIYEDTIFSKTTEYSQTIGGGISLEFEHGRWNLGTGLEYRRTRINPMREIIGIGDDQNFYGVEYESVDLHFLTIPISLRYKLFSSGNSNWYGQFGVRLHMSSKIKYNISIFPGLNPTNTYYLDEMAVHSVTDDAINYISLNTGIGYQKMITPTLSAFGSTGFEFFGQKTSDLPSQEVINVFRVDAGIRFKF